MNKVSTHRISLEPAFVLHRRPYRNTSLIVELFSRYHGRVAVVARSARGLKSRYKGILQPFSPLLASWSGRNELKSLGQVELNESSYRLDGKALLSGFYLNELLIKLLQHDDPYLNLFDAYQRALLELQNGSSLERTLRCFEIKLVQELGYGLSLHLDAQTGEPLSPEIIYQYIPERGFIESHYHKEVAGKGWTFPGRSLIALHNEQLDDTEILKDAKRLMRVVLAHHLQDKLIKSRELVR